MTRATGIVLAGGDSTRFGDAEKALADLDGEPLVARVVGAVREATGRPPVVAVRRDDQCRRLSGPLDGARFACDAPGFEGPLAGVVGALEAVETPWTFVCGCDMPLLSASAVAWLLARVPDDDDALAVVHPDGTAEPMHACYRRRAIAAVRAAVPRSGGVRALLEALDAETVPIDAAPDDVGLVDSVTNVNTREELDAVRGAGPD